MIRRLRGKRELIPAVLAVVAFIAGVIESPYFLDFRHLLSASSPQVETGLLALGMTLVIVSGEIDLSVASAMALVAGVVALMLKSGLPSLVAIPAGLALGAGLGLINGALIARLKLPSFVVTLATMALYRGVVQATLGDKSIQLPSWLTAFGFANVPGTPIPLALVVLIGFAVLIGLLLHHTVLGRWIFAVGTNAEAAVYSGIPVGTVKMSAFAISGLLAAFAGILMDARLGVARFDGAQGLEIDVITVVVLGGASIYGGVGSVLGSMMALVLIYFVRTGMGLANVTAEYQLAVIGSLLVVAVLIGNVKSRSRPLPGTEVSLPQASSTNGTPVGKS